MGIDSRGYHSAQTSGVSCSTYWFHHCPNYFSCNIDFFLQKHIHMSRRVFRLQSLAFGAVRNIAMLPFQTWAAPEPPVTRLRRAERAAEGTVSQCLSSASCAGVQRVPWTWRFPTPLPGPQPGAAHEEGISPSSWGEPVALGTAESRRSLVLLNQCHRAGTRIQRNSSTSLYKYCFSQLCPPLLQTPVSPMVPSGGREAQGVLHWEDDTMWPDQAAWLEGSQDWQGARSRGGSCKWPEDSLRTSFFRWRLKYIGFGGMCPFLILWF